MKQFALAILLAMLCLASLTAFAQNTNLRGSVTGFDGKTISVKLLDGRNVQVDLPDNTPISITKPFKLSDLKPGQNVAVTTIKRASDGATVAIDVRPLSATASQGLSPYDLQPGSTMTNAILDGMVQSTNGQELTLNYKTGTVKVLVPEGTPMSQSAPGERSDIKVGEGIFIVQRPAEGGRMTVTRVQVGKDGVKPTQ